MNTEFKPVLRAGFYAYVRAGIGMQFSGDDRPGFRLRMDASLFTPAGKELPVYLHEPFGQWRLPRERTEAARRLIQGKVPDDHVEAESGGEYAVVWYIPAEELDGVAQSIKTEARRVRWQRRLSRWGIGKPVLKYIGL